MGQFAYGDEDDVDFEMERDIDIVDNTRKLEEEGQYDDADWHLISL